MTKKLSQKFTQTEVHSQKFTQTISRLYEFLQNPQSRAHSGPVSETSRSLSREKQGTNYDGSQKDPHPEVGVSMSHSSQDLNPEETSYEWETSSG